MPFESVKLVYGGGVSTQGARERVTARGQPEAGSIVAQTGPESGGKMEQI